VEVNLGQVPGSSYTRSAGNITYYPEHTVAGLAPSIDPDGGKVYPAFGGLCGYLEDAGVKDNIVSSSVKILYKCDMYCCGEVGATRQLVGGFDMYLVKRPAPQDPVFRGQDITGVRTCTVFIGIPAGVAGVGIITWIQYAQLGLCDVAGVYLAIAGGVARAVA
jgi:hypothetical protein